MAAVYKLRRDLKIRTWTPTAPIGSAARKRSLAKYRREVALPAVTAMASDDANLGPLPWAWIAAHGGIAFPRVAFNLWWQLRTIGAPHPRWCCPWCVPHVACTRPHLVTECVSFAARCWLGGVRPEEAFCFPADDKWFTAILLITAALNDARRDEVDPQTSGQI